VTVKPERTKKPAAATPERPRNARRALSHVGGEIESRSTRPEDQRVLERALAVRADETLTMLHVHGFHSYPARLHPETARHLVAGLSHPGARVLDPFCGSGTVLVEARLLGRAAFGVDANPLATELTWLKTRGSDAAFEAALRSAATLAVEHAEGRRAKRLGPTRPYPPEDRELFDTHVLLELDGLRDALLALPKGDVRRALLLVLSSALTKVSLRGGDTGRRGIEKRIAGGFTIRFFQKKAEDLLRRMGRFTSQLPAGVLAAKCGTGDARQLEMLRDRSIELVVSSPPYPGVYDYVDHHESRLRWLGFDAHAFAAGEIGARRQFSRLGAVQARARWEREFGACLSEMARVLAPDGTAALVIADSVLGGHALYADEVLARLAPLSRLVISAVASQKRPYFHAPTAAAFRARGRREHVFLLRPVADTSRSPTPTGARPRARPRP
jgi:SAM-dependent methyltransferase